MDPFSMVFGGGGGGFSFSDQLENRVSNRVGPIDNRTTFGTSQGFTTLQIGMVAGAVLLTAMLLRGGKK